MTKELSRQRRWQIKQKAMGNCVQCGKPRGEDGTVSHCRFHANRQSKLQRATRMKNKDSRYGP